MGSLRLVTILLLLGSPAFAQSPHIWRGTHSDAEESAAWISRLVLRRGAPSGRGTAKEGAQVFDEKGCIACHGPAGLGNGARVAIEKSQDVPSGNGSASLPLRSPLRRRFGLHQSGMPAGMGDFTANEVYPDGLPALLDKVSRRTKSHKQSLPKSRCRLAMITPSA